jgi:hypothetical protein
MAGRTSAPQRPHILLVESNSRRNTPGHTFTIHRSAPKGKWRTGGPAPSALFCSPNDQRFSGGAQRRPLKAQVGRLVETTKLYAMLPA